MATIRKFLSLFACLWITAIAAAQAPALPDGLLADPRVSWKPTLAETASVVVDSAGGVTDWRSGVPVDVPTKGREPLTVAAELLTNNAGQWVGIYGRHGSVKLGAKVDADESARAQGFQGISFVGLDADSSTSEGAVIGGFNLAQYVGVQRDLAFLNLTIDSWTNRPCTTSARANPTFGHLYLERVELLGICNDLKGLTLKGDATTTWFFRLEGYVQAHFVDVRTVGGVVKGDGLDGSSEHGVYQNGPAGDSEFIGVRFHGCQISALYFVTRFADRISGPGGFVERYGRGTLLIEDLLALDCGVNGSFAVNVCGGPELDVVVRNYTYRVNLDGYDLSGQVPGGKWAGGALQVYCDHKAYELAPPINSNSKPVALGYSLETGTSLPMSAGVEALGLTWDGLGGARSLTIVGGMFQAANLTPPFFNLRDCKAVTVIEREPGTRRFQTSGGRAWNFGSSGLASACGKMGDGRVPAKAGAGWSQQALFVSASAPSKWAGQVKMSPAAATLTAVELDSWGAQP